MVRERVERVERGGSTLPSSAQDTLSIAEIRQLISLMSSSDIEEIAIEQEGKGVKLRLAKPAPVAVAFGEDGGFDDGSFIAELAVEESAAPQTCEIGAPLVGIYRSSMKVGGKALIQPGDVVRQGQVVAAIEALNVLNEVEATSAGRVSEILVTDGQPVEYGQLLLTIEPQSA